MATDRHDDPAAFRAFLDLKLAAPGTHFALAEILQPPLVRQGRVDDSSQKNPIESLGNYTNFAYFDVAFNATTQRDKTHQEMKSNYPGLSVPRAPVFARGGSALAA